MLDLSAMLSPACRRFLFPISFPVNHRRPKFVCPSGSFAHFPPAKSHVCWRKPPVSAQKRIHKKERERRRRREAPAWLEAVSSYSKRAVQVSYRRCTAHPRGARFTVLVQSAKQMDQLGDISKRSWNKAGEEGINSLQGGMFQLTHCQTRRIPSLPCKNAAKGFFRCVPQPSPVHRNPCTPTPPRAPQPALHTPSQPRRGLLLHQRHAGGRPWLRQPPGRCSSSPDGCRRGTACPGLGSVASLPARPPTSPTLAEQLQVSDLLAHLELQDLLQDLLPLRLVSDAHALQLLPVQPQQRPTCKRGAAQWHGGDAVKAQRRGCPRSRGDKEGEREEILKCSFTTWTRRGGEASRGGPRFWRAPGGSSRSPTSGQVLASAIT